MRRNTEVYAPGTVVRKISGKPFKSGPKVGTVITVVPHPCNETLGLAYLMDDGSYVATRFVEAVNE